MKKKIFAIVLVLCFSFTALSALGIDLSGDVGLGYMNYVIITEYENSALEEDLKEGLESAVGTGNLTMDNPKSKDTYNALNIGLSLKYSYFYTNLAIAFPFTQVPSGQDPLGEKLKDMGASNKIKGSIIFDSQFGAGITLFKKTDLNIFLGGAVGFNYIRTKRELPQKFVDTIKGDDGKVLAKSLTEIRSKAMLGLGVDVGVRYFFTDHIGIGLDLKDTVYFLPLSTKRYYKGTAKNGGSFTYTITKDGTEDIKSLIKYSWANNFSMRLGMAFKL